MFPAVSPCGCNISLHTYANDFGYVYQAPIVTKPVRSNMVDLNGKVWCPVHSWVDLADAQYEEFSSIHTESWGTVPSNRPDVVPILPVDHPSRSVSILEKYSIDDNKK